MINDIKFDQGFCHRSEQSTGIFYADTYITRFKRDLLELFQEEKNVAFKRMNAAMMQHELKKVSAFVVNTWGNRHQEVYFMSLCKG